MGGGSEWDKRMMESMKNFDLSSPEVKQQFGESEEFGFWLSAIGFLLMLKLYSVNNIWVW